MTDVRIAALVLNWENPQHTIACLDSLFAAVPKPEAVIVVDNASRDDSLDRLTRWARDHGIESPHLRGPDLANQPLADVAVRESRPWLILISAPENRGFATGNNFGLKYFLQHRDLTHVLLLNNDATVRADTFTELKRALAEVEGAGLITGTIYVDRGNNDECDVWYAGGVEQPLRGLTRHITAVPRSRNPTLTEFVSGCAMLISRGVLDQIGLLAECYSPFYYEDAEYSRRARLAGFPVVYAPAAVFYHKVGATIGPARQSPRVTYAQNRNRLFYIRRNFGGVTRMAAVLYMLVSKPVRALIEVGRGRRDFASAVLKGTWAGIRDDPSAEFPAPIR
jgi:hypothetical protein